MDGLNARFVAALKEIVVNGVRIIRGRAILCCRGLGLAHLISVLALAFCGYIVIIGA